METNIAEVVQVQAAWAPLEQCSYTEAEGKAEDKAADTKLPTAKWTHLPYSTSHTNTVDDKAATNRIVYVRTPLPSRNISYQDRKSVV